jgi:ribosomal protein S18 acetylase RimI-like enzyme
MASHAMPSIKVEATEAFRNHLGGRDFSESAYQRFVEDPLLDLDLLATAYDGDEMAASVQGAVDLGENEANGYLRGWTDPVWTRRAWRRRGLAYALLGRSLEQLRERGMTSAQLFVDSENDDQVLTLYERHRYEVARSFSEWHKLLEP